MPGNVQTAVATTSLPAALAAAFSRAEEYPVLVNAYPNGESQRDLLGTTSRPRWSITRLLTPAAMGLLRDFYEARRGPVEAFNFQDEFGVGHIVRFAGDWAQTWRLGRGEAAFDLVEIA